MPTALPPHLVLPFAACSGPAWLQAMKALPAGSLKNLQTLLQGMKRLSTSGGPAFSLSTPHERVLAQAQGIAGPALVDGLIPWAAAQAAKTQTHAVPGLAWAFITPCHWAMGREHATLTDPAAVALTHDESATLLAAMQPYFETEGITLHHAAADRWLAEGEVFRHLPSASLDRVLGRNVDPWLPGAANGEGRSASQEVQSVAAKILRRLQNEMQMLLYTHALNDARSERRQLTVNSFWLSGTGALTQAPASALTDIAEQRHLAQAAFADDWSAYAQAWQQLDAGAIAELLKRQRAGETVQLSLCGERTAQTFESARPGIFSRISSFLSPQPPLDLLGQL